MTRFAKCLWDEALQRPKFAAAWAASYRIYDPANPGEKVAQVIGGAVATKFMTKSGRGKTLAPFA
jgi:hypothetical protein